MKGLVDFINEAVSPRQLQHIKDVAAKQEQAKKQNSIGGKFLNLLTGAYEDVFESADIYKGTDGATELADYIIDLGSEIFEDTPSTSTVRKCCKEMMKFGTVYAICQPNDIADDDMQDELLEMVENECTCLEEDSYSSGGSYYIKDEHFAMYVMMEPQCCDYWFFVGTDMI